MIHQPPRRRAVERASVEASAPASTRRQNCRRKSPLETVARKCYMVCRLAGRRRVRWHVDACPSTRKICSKSYISCSFLEQTGRNPEGRVGGRVGWPVDAECTSRRRPLIPCWKADTSPVHRRMRRCARRLAREKASTGPSTPSRNCVDGPVQIVLKCPSFLKCSTQSLSCIICCTYCPNTPAQDTMCYYRCKTSCLTHKNMQNSHLA